MTYRGVYRDGIVVLQGDVDLRNGAPVDVKPVPSGRASARPRAASRRSPSAKAGSRNTKVAQHRLPGFGMWKDRWPKSMSSADIARELRERVSRRVP
jgi:hypothetical protein